MEFDRKDIKMNKLVITGLESKMAVYDLRTFHPKKGFSSLQEKVPATPMYAPAPSIGSLIFIATQG